MKGKLTILALGAAWLLLPATIGGPPAKGRYVTVHIQRLKQINNLDKDFPRNDQADFYARISFGNKQYRTPTMIRDDGRPNWRTRHWITGDSTMIRIRIMDDDGGLEDKDDHVDINPRLGEKTLVLTYDMKSGWINGDASGRRGKTIHIQGMHEDTDKAQIWFSVR